MPVQSKPADNADNAGVAEISEAGDIAKYPFGDLLRRFVAHVSEVAGSPFVLTVTPSSAGLTHEEVSFLLSLEAQAVREKEHRQRMRQAEDR